MRRGEGGRTGAFPGGGVRRLRPPARPPATINPLNSIPPFAAEPRPPPNTPCSVRLSLTHLVAHDDLLHPPAMLLHAQREDLHHLRTVVNINIQFK